MKLKTILAAACLMLAGCASAPAPAPAPVEATQARAQVMVLGVYHFRAGGSDYVENRVDDHLSPERQAQIADVLDRLERFRPTKIMIELNPEAEAEFNARYQRYRAGAEALTVNERDQLGMALANRLGLDRLYAVDASSNMDFQGMMAAAEANGQSHLVEQFNADTAVIEAHMTATQGLSVRERLIDMNSEDVASWHNTYMSMAQMGSRDNPIGARDMAAWWSRNLYIFANIAREAEPGDRVLVIYGSGHKFLLDQYFTQAREFELVDPRDYLR